MLIASVWLAPGLGVGGVLMNRSQSSRVGEADSKAIMTLLKCWVLPLMDSKGLRENSEFQNAGTHAPEYWKSLCRERAMMKWEVHLEIWCLFIQFFTGKCKGPEVVD